MKRIVTAFAGAACAILMAFVAPAAYAGTQSPTQAWNSSWAPDDANQQQVNLNSAVADELARKGGYGSSIYNSNSSQLIESQIINHNGPETSSSSTNVNNLSQSSNTNTVGAGSSGVNITATTGSSQYSHDTHQGATAQATVAYPSSNVSSDSTTSNH